jgi:hypothetical protein
MRFHEFKHQVKEEEITEIIPAIAAIGRVGATMGSAVAKGVGKMAGQAVKLGSKAANVAGKVAKGAAKTINKAQDKVAGAVLKKGSQLSMPSQGGSEQEFSIQDVKGDQVTLANPKAGPGEPQAFIYNKKELDPIIKAKADAIAGKGNVDKGGQVV